MRGYCTYLRYCGGGVMNPCNGCTKCCYGLLPLSEADYQALPDKHFAIAISGAETQYSYILSEPTKYIIDPPDGAPCPYLVNNECSIYENRPEICRIFPAPYHYGVFVKWLKENCVLSR